MRLINTRALEFHEFGDGQVPHYAILSHTWGDSEFSYQQHMSGSKSHEATPGYRKFIGLCRQSAQDGYEYCWMDTCCIDKTSSAELSEAINSMFRWYQNADVCYVYLSDVRATLGDSGHLPPDFERARWFVRSWTLQELIAPNHVVFFDNEWNAIGTKSGLSHELQRITGIPEPCLRASSGSVLAQYSVAEKMSWAATRQTTRREDLAYSLMGLFNIHMSILYGEGERAFWRLQTEILKQTTDQSVLVWRMGGPGGVGPIKAQVFADSPSLFYQPQGAMHEQKDPIIAKSSHGSRLQQRMEYSNIGLLAWMPLIGTLSSRLYFAALNCEVHHSGESRARLWLVLWKTNTESYLRLGLLSGVVDPSWILISSQLAAPEMICIEDSTSLFDWRSHDIPTTLWPRGLPSGDLTRHGVLIAFQAGKQNFTRTISFPANGIDGLGIFWLEFQPENFYHGVLAIERPDASPNIPIGLFFAVSATLPAVGTCRVLPALDDITPSGLRRLSESELAKLREGEAMTSDMAASRSPLWRTTDQLGNTNVRMEKSTTIHLVGDGHVMLANVTFDCPPIEVGTSASISEAFHSLVTR